MKLYIWIRQFLPPRPASVVVGLWYGFLIYLIFLGLFVEGADLRYANL